MSSRERATPEEMRPLFSIGPIPVFSTGQLDWSEAALPAGQTAYVIDGKGWKLVKANVLAASRIGIDSIDGLPCLDEAIMLATARIPLELVRKVTAFFAAVYRRQKSEAVGYLLYESEHRRWDFFVPPQTASTGSAQYGAAPRREGWTVAGTIHSHGSMSAFHSGTDHNDERGFDGIHITVGRLDGVPEYSCSIVVDGKRAMYSDVSRLIDGMADDVPPDWMDAVVEPLPSKYKGMIEAEALYSDYMAYKLTSAQLEAALDAFDRRSASQAAPVEKTTTHKEGGSFGFMDGRRFGWGGGKRGK